MIKKSVLLNKEVPTVRSFSKFYLRFSDLNNMSD